MDIVEFPPAVVAAAVDRRDQLSGQVDAAPVVVQFNLHFGVKFLRGVLDIGFGHELVAAVVPGIAGGHRRPGLAAFAPADQRQAVFGIFIFIVVVALRRGAAGGEDGCRKREGCGGEYNWSFHTKGLSIERTRCRLRLRIWCLQC